MKVKITILILAIIGLTSILLLKKDIQNEAVIGLKPDVSSKIRHSQTQPAPRLRRAPAIHPGDKSPDILATENKSVENKVSSKLIVGTSADFAPFSFLEDGQIVGFDIDIAKEIAKRLDLPIEIINRSFDMLIPELQLNKIQIIAAGMSTTEERKKQALFTEPHIEGTKLIAISKKNKKINSFDDLKKEEIIVNTGYKADLFLSDFNDIKLKRLPTVTDALLALNSNKGDVFVTAENTVKPFFNQHSKNEYNIYTLEEGQEDTALAVGKKYTELYKKINKIIKKMKKDGTVEKLEKKWGIK